MKRMGKRSSLQSKQGKRGIETISRIIHSITVAQNLSFLLSGWMNESAANSTPFLLLEWAEGSSLGPFLNSQNFLQLTSSTEQP